MAGTRIAEMLQFADEFEQQSVATVAAEERASRPPVAEMLKFADQFEQTSGVGLSGAKTQTEKPAMPKVGLAPRPRQPLTPTGATPMYQSPSAIRPQVEMPGVTSWEFAPVPSPEEESLPTGIMGLAGKEMWERTKQPFIAAAGAAQSVPIAAGAALHMVGEEWANPQFYSDIAKGMGAFTGATVGQNPWFLTQKVAQGLGKVIPAGKTNRKQNIVSFAGQAAYDHYRAMQEELAAKVPTSISKPEPLNPQWWINSLADAGTSMAASLALGGGNPGAAALIGSMMEAGPFYEDLKKDKDRHAGAKAMAFGAAVAGLERIGFDQIFKKVKPGIIRQVIQKVIAGLTEGTTEIAEEPVGTFIKLLDKQGMTPTEKGKAILDSVKQSWGVGLPTFVLGLLGGGGAGGVATEQRATPPPIPQAARVAQEPGLMLPPEPGPGEYVPPAEGRPQVLEMDTGVPAQQPTGTIPLPARPPPIPQAAQGQAMRPVQIPDDLKTLVTMPIEQQKDALRQMALRVTEQVPDIDLETGKQRMDMFNRPAVRPRVSTVEAYQLGRLMVEHPEMVEVVKQLESELTPGEVPQNDMAALQEHENKRAQHAIFREGREFYDAWTSESPNSALSEVQKIKAGKYDQSLDSLDTLAQEYYNEGDKEIQHEQQTRTPTAAAGAAEDVSGRDQGAEGRVGRAEAAEPAAAAAAEPVTPRKTATPIEQAQAAVDAAGPDMAARQKALDERKAQNPEAVREIEGEGLDPKYVDAVLDSLNDLDLPGTTVRVAGSASGVSRRGMMRSPRDIDILLDMDSNAYFAEDSHPAWVFANHLATQEGVQVWVRGFGETSILQPGEGRSVDRLSGRVSDNAARGVADAVTVPEAIAARAKGPLTLRPDGTLGGAQESAVAKATPQGAAGRPAEPTAIKPGQKAPEKKAAPPSPAEPVSKAKQYSIDKAMDASDTITTQDSKRKKGDARKKEVESAYLSLKTHASKLGINVENVGTYYMIDEYKRIANNVKMEIAKQYGAFPSTKSKAAKAAVDKADAERAKQRTDKQPTAKKVMGEASRFYIEKPEGVRDLAGDVYSAHNRYRRTSRGEDIQARTSAELMLADLGVPKEQILRWREEEPTMSEVQLRQKFGIEMPDWMKSWIESEPEAEPDYESKTKVWLYAEAKKRGLPVTPKMTKRELVVRLSEKATPQAPAPVPKGEKVAEEPITPGGYRKRGLASALKMRQEEPQGSLANYETREQAEWLGRRTVPADGNLTLYRATPTGEAIGPGDYVTNDQDYAQEHIRANLGGEGKITQIEATLDDIYPADGPKEFWYVPKSLTREAVAPAKSVADARAEPEADAAKPEAKPLTVAAALAAGKPVKPPKGATFVRMTDSKGNTAVVAIADMDTLKGVDIADVKFGVWGKKGFTPMNEKGTVAAATAPEDIAAEAEKARKGGFVAVPADASGPRRVYANLAAWLGRQGRTGGLGETLFQQFLGQRATASANRLRANIVRDELRRTRKELNRKFLPASVSVALDAVERGEMTVADFSTRFGLKPDSAYVKTLQNALDLRSTQRERLSKLEKESSLDRAELLAQNEAYLHTMYRVHLDPYYRPSSEAVKAANAHLLQQFTGQVDNLAKRASAAFRTTNVDVAEYLRTGDETLLEGLAPKNPKVVGAKWKERKLAQLHSMRQTADKMDRFIDEMAVGEDEITIEKNQVALNDAASSLVNELIEEQKRGYEPGGSAEGASATGALKQRTLDDPIIKKLFGEITDPVERLGTSLQIQGELIALRTLENRIHQEGKNKWWTEERSDATGTTKQLPNNVAMGPLAGKWVSPAIANQLAPKLPNKALRIYYRIMGTQRIAQLMTVGSFARDFTSNIGYALAADPVESPTYLRNFAAALRLQTRLALGKTDAREKVVDYIRKGVWDARGSGQLGDVEALLRTDVSSKVQQAWEKLANIRSQPDFAWKIASYETALKKTGNHKQALEHVRKFFQYYDENPKFVQWAAKIPVVEDYPNFWIGSTRIIANQLENVYNEAKKGNPIPLARFVAGHALCIQLTALMTSWLRKLRERIMEPVIEKATGNKVVIDDAEKNTALRTLLPGFWKNAPSVSWTETNADGTKQKRYMVLQNMTAYPTDELLTGVLQRSDLSLGDKAGEFVAQIARDRLGWNMMFSTGYEAMTGEPPEATYQQKGIMDLGHADPDTGKVIAEAAGTVLGQMLGGQTYRRGRAVLRGTMTPGAAVASWLGVPRVYTVNDELAQKMLRGTLNKYRTSLDAYARRIRENTRKDEDTTENEAGQARVLAQMGREVNAFRTWAGDIVSEADITEIVKSMRFDVKQDLKYQEILGRVVPAPKRTRRR